MMFGPFVSNVLSYVWSKLQTFNGGIAWPGGSFSASAPAGSLDVVASGETIFGYNVAFNTASAMLTSGSSTWPLIFGISSTEKARLAGTTGHLLLNTTTDNGTDTLQVNGSLIASELKTTQNPTASSTASNYSVPIVLNGTTYYMRLSTTP